MRLNKELATIDLAGYAMAAFNALPDPDEVLRKSGLDVSTYRQLLYDTQVGSAYDSRRAGTTSLEWVLNQGKSKARITKFVQEYLDTLDMDRLISDILEAPFYGAQPIELVWGKEGSSVLPVKLEAKPVEWFTYDNRGQLMLKTTEHPTGKVVPDFKFLNPRNRPTVLNPYGERILSKCFWPVAFKKGTMKFWVVFCEKYGMPYPIGKAPAGISKVKRAEFLDMLDKMIQDGVAVIPNDSSVEILETGQASSSDIYDRFVEVNDKSISKAILGHSATIDSTPGKLGSDEQATKVMDYIIDADQRLVQKTVNQLIDWIVEINFGKQPGPRFILFEEKDVQKVRAERDKILTDTGLKFTVKYYMDNYGFNEDEIELAAEDSPAIPIVPPAALPPGINPPNPEEFAEFQHILKTGLSPRVAKKALDGYLKPIIDLVEESESYEEILERLNDQFPIMDTSVMETLIGQAIFVSQEYGKATADET